MPFLSLSLCCKKTDAVTVVPIYKAFILKYPTLENLAKASNHELSELIAPDKEVGKWNLTLLDFGSMICMAKNPLCHDCPLATKCNYFQIQTNENEIPTIKKE